jgi:hypothetical protein
VRLAASKKKADVVIAHFDAFKEPQKLLKALPPRREGQSWVVFGHEVRFVLLNR